MTTYSVKHGPRSGVSAIDAVFTNRKPQGEYLGTEPGGIRKYFVEGPSDPEIIKELKGIEGVKEVMIHY